MQGAQEPRGSRGRESSHDSEDHSSKIAHTLAACCRCRQRKTRCDPTLPRCLPCERSGAICEYFDTTKGKKISRTYVIRLQDKVRALEAELSTYTEEEIQPHDSEAAIRPGGLVRLDENDETPRFLGPSSGIAMTRLVMEEAKKYTDSRSIRELVPEVSTRRTPAQSPEAYPERKISYPMISAVPADRLPSPLVTDKLVEVFNQKSQYLLPTLHEPTFARELKEVYGGDTDPYKNFVLRMVLAISMQKLDTQYAGLADSYYLAAMLGVEAVIRPKDIKTLQCLVLIAQYSLLTPTRTAIYYIVGLATRLCQQLGLTEEKTITSGVSQGLIDPLQLDMRRRLSWIVLSMEFGLAHSLGRPNGFAIGQDHVDVGFYAAVDDEYITSDGIRPAPPSEKKTMGIHFLKMRLLQAEIRRVLYQRKRSEPKNEDHLWYPQMEKKLQAWLDACPKEPAWSKSWFTGRFNTMIIFLYRPSPQVPKPTARAAKICYDAAIYNVRLSEREMDNPSTDVTWIFVQALFMVINTMLWATSFPEVRALHGRQELDDLLQLGIKIIVRCTDRWPGSRSAAALYTKLGKACLKSYDSPVTSSLSETSPSSISDTASPNSEYSSVTTGSAAFSAMTEPPPSFSHVFGQAPDSFASQEYYTIQAPPSQPSFRSGSIFMAPSTNMPMDRRFSYFPPEFTNQNLPNAWEPMIPPQIPQTVSQIPPGMAHARMPAFSGMAAGDAGFFMQPQFNFGPHMFAENSVEMQDRNGSLSMQQQEELMRNLETEGVTGIDSYLGLNPIMYDPNQR